VAVRGEQRAGLIFGCGVVHHHQDSPALFGEGRQHRAVEPGAILQFGGHVLGRQPKRAKQAVKRPLS